MVKFNGYDISYIVAMVTPDTFATEIKLGWKRGGPTPEHFETLFNRACDAAVRLVPFPGLSPEASTFPRYRRQIEAERVGREWLRRATLCRDEFGRRAARRIGIVHG